MEDKLLNLGLNQDDILDAQLAIVEESITMYNLFYATSYSIDTIPNSLLALIALNTLMTTQGWDDSYNAKFDTQTIKTIQSVYGEKYREYGGIEQTNAAILEDETNVDNAEFIDTRTEVLFAGLFVVYQLTHEALAQEDGRKYVGVITRQDDKVRKTHQPNNNRFWEVGTRHDFAHDFNCRCTYLYFKSPQEARRAGFSQFS